MKTLHNEVELGQTDSTVLMPGDPLRVKYIAQTYSTDVVCYDRIKGMNGHTGYYKGKRVSARGSGMGTPFMSIYVHELYQNYDVDTITRIGTASAIHRDVEVGDLIFAMGRCTNPDFPAQYHLSGAFVPIVDLSLLSATVSQAQGSGIPFRVGNVFSLDVFYEDQKGEKGGWEKMGVLVQEMETLSLYCTAARAGKCALGMLTAGSSIHTDRALTNGERERNLDAMIQCASEIA